MTRDKIRKELYYQNPIAKKTGETAEGDFYYLTVLKDGTEVNFFVPKKDTFLQNGGSSRMNDQEFAKHLGRWLVINK